jgi:hypothetical protein
MFRKKNATWSPWGIRASVDTENSSTVEATSSAPYPPNQGRDLRGPTKAKAASGEAKAQIATALEARNPPRVHCRANGRISISTSWLDRKNPYRLVLANHSRLATDST